MEHFFRPLDEIREEPVDSGTEAENEILEPVLQFSWGTLEIFPIVRPIPLFCKFPMSVCRVENENTSQPINGAEELHPLYPTQEKLPRSQ